MTDGSDTGGLRAVPETWMRDVDKALTGLENTISETLTLVAVAVARWCSASERFEGLVRDILAAEQHATTDTPSPSCDQ